MHLLQHSIHGIWVAAGSCVMHAVSPSPLVANPSICTMLEQHLDHVGETCPACKHECCLAPPVLDVQKVGKLLLIVRGTVREGHWVEVVLGVKYEAARYSMQMSTGHDDQKWCELHPCAHLEAIEYFPTCTGDGGGRLRGLRTPSDFPEMQCCAGRWEQKSQFQRRNVKRAHEGS